MATSADIFQTALTSAKPVEALLDIAATSIQNKEFDSLHDVDVMLIDRFIEFIRSGTHDDLHAFLYSILSFTDSNAADALHRRLKKASGIFTDGSTSTTCVILP